MIKGYMDPVITLYLHLSKADAVKSVDRALEAGYSHHPLLIHDGLMVDCTKYVVAVKSMFKILPAFTFCSSEIDHDRWRPVNIVTAQQLSGADAVEILAPAIDT
jgi:hypothetical protein